MRSCRSCLLLALVFFAGCGDEEVIKRYPIRPFLLSYVTPVIAPPCNPGPNFISVGAIVGFWGCGLESAAVDIRQDSLFVSGVARCVFRRTSPLIGAPAAPNPQLLSIQLPELEPGQYTLCAGDLCSELTVTSACLPPVSRRLYAYGSFASSDSCLVFLSEYGFQSYETVGVELPAPQGSVRIYGTDSSRSYCDSLLDGTVQVWSVETLDEPAEGSP